MDDRLGPVGGASESGGLRPAISLEDRLTLARRRRAASLSAGEGREAASRSPSRSDLVILGLSAGFAAFGAVSLALSLQQTGPRPTPPEPVSQVVRVDTEAPAAARLPELPDAAGPLVTLAAPAPPTMLSVDASQLQLVTGQFLRPAARPDTLSPVRTAASRVSKSARAVASPASPPPLAVLNRAAEQFVRDGATLLRQLGIRLAPRRSEH